MNKRRLAVIARWLEAGAPHRKGVAGFWMVEFTRTSECGTTCCIAGAANQWWSPIKNSPAPLSRSDFPLADRAAEVLGLDKDTAYRLFGIDREENNHTSPAWAARCIRKLIATGQVDWEGTRP